MKPIFILSLVFVSGIAQAQIFTTEIVGSEQPAATSADPNLQIVISESRTEAKAVEDCTNCSFSSGRSQAPSAFASVRQTGEHLSRVNASEGWKNSCDGFVKDGQIGPYGEMVREQIMKPSLFKNIKQGDSDLNRLCPNYEIMNESSKANVILLIMTSMAFEESSCDNNKSARGPNGIAKGFFQLHSGDESSYSPGCSNYDSRTPKGSITCALNILDLQMSKGNMFRQQENYWDVLRPKRWNKKTKSYFSNPSYAQIRSAISSFAPCTQRQSLQADSATINKQLYIVMDQKFFHKQIGN